MCNCAGVLTGVSFVGSTAGTVVPCQVTIVYAGEGSFVCPLQVSTGDTISAFFASSIAASSPTPYFLLLSMQITVDTNTPSAFLYLQNGANGNL